MPLPLFFVLFSEVHLSPCYTFRVPESAWVRNGMHDIKIVIGGCVRKLCADILPFFVTVNRLQKQKAPTAQAVWRGPLLPEPVQSIDKTI